MSEHLSLVQRWIAAINNADLAGLSELMSSQHIFYVEGDTPTQGKAKLVKAWHNYFATFPQYRIYIDGIEQRGRDIFVSAHTGGSHIDGVRESVPGCILLHAQVVNQKVAQWVVYSAQSATLQNLNLSF